MNPPVLAAPIKGRPLLLYITALDHSLGALLAQQNDEEKEQALYYLSRRMVGAEHNYSPIEKYCLALIFVLQKLRHYLFGHVIRLVSKVDPLKYLMARTAWEGRIAKWALFLMEFDITFTPQKAIKGQALAYFLAAHPIPDDSPLAMELPDEEIFSNEFPSCGWEMYFDGASRTIVETPTIPFRRTAGIGIVFLTSTKGIIHFSFSLEDECTNNEAEYKTLIAGLLMAKEVVISTLKAFGDSQLVICQVKGIYE